MAALVASAIFFAIDGAFAQGHSTAQTPPAADGAYRVFTATGKPAALKDVIEAMGAADAVFIGEQHNDPTAHRLEAELLQAATERYGRGAAANATARNVVLSLEMFERDVQTPLDEYLAGLIAERHFLAGSRPWNNYATDYRPLVEFARERKLPVIAANAPERYVNRVGRLGAASLMELSGTAKHWLAPLPYKFASPAYAAKFAQFMNADTAGHAMHGGGASKVLEAQALRDATMGFAIAEKLKAAPKALVLHVNGGFHSAGRLGVPEQLLGYRPQTRLMVVDIVPSDGFDEASAFRSGQSGQPGDFVIVTNASIQRSF
ncbi:MAG: ChaN family lipoprotein [Pyrinomonadaceae bacterium]